ncbi:tRNA1(Val) (adenine(37)-N6)-methyltransferase [Methylocystis sp. ATCC 49242]|uniref:tRNA1(Val) (adenine(37)-N6)-methyltransferase n=1 Tax=Methylocystis sp. ATCC 49242 TaxID=622637 RepID=UPI0001F883EC|nr:methyltransferase [Methylocystis sp. ATCC 49242]
MSADSTDGFLDGRLRLRQGRGHRAGTDAVLLSAVTPPGETGLILDVGAGAGAVGLMAAVRAPGAAIGLVEIDPGAAALARENVAANGLADRVSVFEADVTAPGARRAAGLSDEKAALVLTNPPFYEVGRVRVTPDAAKALAHVAAVPLAGWTRACLALLAPGGTFAMIHRAEALADCLAAVEARLGAVSILPILPRAGAPASRILLCGVKGSRAPLSLLAPLVLHGADGRFTEEAERMNRGETGV